MKNERNYLLIREIYSFPLFTKKKTKLNLFKKKEMKKTKIVLKKILKKKKRIEREILMHMFESAHLLFKYSVRIYIFNSHYNFNFLK